MVGAVGVIYGDIGTSPLYTMRACFSDRYGIPLTPANVLGLVSLVLWALVVVVALKYVTIMLRADNRGEGGILALMALARGGAPMALPLLTLLGLLGAALFFGDALITPAISVLAAVEGLEIVTPALEPSVVPIAVLILVGLFAIQGFGTSQVGAAFGPIMLVWFAVLAILGIHAIAAHPGVLAALDPRYALGFFADNGVVGFLALGAVVLAVTGGEALYADMGHFGRRPVRLSWYGIVLPALALNYLGQGALVLAEPDAVASPFFHMAPKALLPLLVVLATTATIIASQAVISGAFSLTHQAIQLGFWPRSRIMHTSAEQIGQVYLPHINWLLLVGVLALVVTFGSSADLAAAYGIAVTGTMTVTTLLAFNVASGLWGWGILLAGAVLTPLLLVDLAFLGANLLKLPNGGWLPIGVGGCMLLLMTTWRRGREIMAARLARDSQPVGPFLRSLREREPQRVPGTAVYLTGDLNLAPRALLLNLRWNKVLHEKIVLLTMVTTAEPRVARDQRVTISDLLPGVLRVEARYGFMEQPNVTQALYEARRHGLRLEWEDTVFFASRELPQPTPGTGMWLWRERLFAAMTWQAASVTEFFRVPVNHVVELRIRVPI
jgi:KUP system potassium uptake protein